MPIELITGPANAGKAHLVLEALRAHLARDREPILVVPTDSDQALYRRELAEGGATLGARVERFEGLLSEICRRAGRGEAVLGRFARERVLSSIAARSLAVGERSLPERPPLGWDGHRGVSSGLTRALSELVAELQVARVSPPRLRAAVERWAQADGAEGSRFASSLCEVYSAYHELLAEGRRTDRESRAVRSLDALRRAPALWGETPVLRYGFDSFTDLELDAIETLGAVLDAPVIVSLSYEPGRLVFAGRAEAFQRLSPLARTHVELPPLPDHYEPQSRRALHHLERNLLEEPSSLVVPGEADSLPAPEDALDRVDPGLAVGLLEGGSPRAELELVAGEVRALLDEGVGAEEIAIVHRTPDRVAGLLAEVLEDFGIPHPLRALPCVGQTAIGRALVGLMRCAAPDGRLADLLAWLRAPGLLDRPQLADALEARMLRRGLTDADGARAAWEAEHWPLRRVEEVRSAAAEGEPRRLIAALLEELERLFCAPRHRQAAVLAERELQEARSLTAIRQALEELDDLAGWAPETVPGLTELADLLQELPLRARERPPAGRVIVSDPLSLRARRVKALFVCGLQEGVFPATACAHPLLDVEDRRSLARASGLVLAREPDSLAAERYLLYALCSRPQQRLRLSWHTADDDGSPAARSLFVDDICDLFDERLAATTRRRAAGALAWPGPGAPAGAMAARAAAAEGSRAVAEGAVTPEPTIAPLSDAAVLEELRARDVWSASSLETWVACPVRWLVERLLSLKGLEADSEPLARGALAHAVLRQTFERLREHTGSARLAPASLEQAKRLLGEALAEHSGPHLIGLSPERIPAIVRRLRADLERYLAWAADTQSPLEPAHFELEFGLDGGRGRAAADGRDGLSPSHDGLPGLDLGQGVAVRGRIDRVDVSPAGQAVVYDYKGRTAPPGGKWAREGALQVALYMAAVQRLLGLEPIGGFYQPLAGRDLRPRGLIDADAGVELDVVRTDRVESAELHETLEECRQAALTAVAEARAGGLEPRPGTCGYGGVCLYPEICRCER